MPATEAVQLKLNPLMPCCKCAGFGAEYGMRVDEWAMFHPKHPTTILRALVPTWKCACCGFEWDNEPAADDVRYITEQEYLTKGRQ